MAASMGLAQALPVTTADTSGLAGTDVHVVLSDTVQVPANPFSGVFGIGIRVVYDSTTLTFKGGSPGTIRGDDIPDPFDPTITIPGVSLLGADTSDPLFFVDKSVPTAAELILSLAYSLPGGANPGPGSLLDLVFTIDPTATPGTMTDVDFACDDVGGTRPCDYPFSPVSSTITVLQSTGTPMPLPGTLPLIGLGMMALAWASRRRH